MELIPLFNQVGLDLILAFSSEVSSSSDIAACTTYKNGILYDDDKEVIDNIFESDSMKKLISGDTIDKLFALLGFDKIKVKGCLLDNHEMNLISLELKYDSLYIYYSVYLDRVHIIIPHGGLKKLVIKSFDYIHFSKILFDIIFQADKLIKVVKDNFGIDLDKKSEYVKYKSYRYVGLDLEFFTKRCNERLEIVVLPNFEGRKDLDRLKDLNNIIKFTAASFD